MGALVLPRLAMTPRFLNSLLRTNGGDAARQGPAALQGRNIWLRMKVLGPVLLQVTRLQTVPIFFADDLISHQSPLPFVHS
jgi:hypothetical protein